MDRQEHAARTFVIIVAVACILVAIRIIVDDMVSNSHHGPADSLYFGH